MKVWVVSVEEGWIDHDEGVARVFASEESALAYTGGDIHALIEEFEVLP